MSETAERTDLIALLSSLCGQIVPGQPWVAGLRSLRSGTPPHKDNHLRMSPHLAGLAIAAHRISELVQGTEKTSDLMARQAHNLNIGIDFGIPVTEVDMQSLRQKFAGAVRLADLPNAKDSSENVWQAAQDNGIDILFTHRGTQKKKTGRDRTTIFDRAREHVTDTLAVEGPPAATLRAIFNAPLLVYMNPHHEENRAVTKSLHDLPRPDGLDFRTFADELAEAIRGTNGTGQVTVYGVQIDVAKTLALRLPNRVSVAALKIPDGMRTPDFALALEQALTKEKNDVLNFHGNRILVGETINSAQENRYPINELPISPDQVDQKFFDAVNAHVELTTWRPGQTVDIAGLKILPHATRHSPRNQTPGRLVEIVVQERDGRVVLDQPLSEFNLHKTNGRVVTIEDQTQSPLVQTIDQFLGSITLAALTRSHLGLSINGDVQNLIPITDLLETNARGRANACATWLGDRVARISNLNQPMRDPVIQNTVCTAAIAGALGEFSL